MPFWDLLAAIPETAFNVFKSGFEIDQAKRENAWRDDAINTMRPLGDEAKANIGDIGRAHTDADRATLEDVYGKTANNMSDYASQYFGVPSGTGRTGPTPDQRAIYDNFSQMLRSQGGQWNDPRFQQLGSTGIGQVNGHNYTYQDFLNARNAVEGIGQEAGMPGVLNAADPANGQMSRFTRDSLAAYKQDLGNAESVLSDRMGEIGTEMAGSKERYNKAVSRLDTTAAHSIAVAESPILQAGTEALAKMSSRPDAGSPQWQREYDATRLQYHQKAASEAGAMAETTRQANNQLLSALNSNLDSALSVWQGQRTAVGTNIAAMREKFADTSLGMKQTAFQQDATMLDKFRSGLDKLRDTRFQAETAINQNIAQWALQGEQARLTGQTHLADVMAHLQGSVIQFNPFSSALDRLAQHRQGELAEQTNDATRDAAKTSLWGNLIPQTSLNSTIKIPGLG